MSSLAGQRIVVATQNAGKRREVGEILGPRGFTLCDLTDLPRVDFPEEGTDYHANAIGKARAVTEQLGEVALADDSGIEVEGLGGAPGPLSARFGGAGLDAAGRVAHLLSELSTLPGASRLARFVCHVALVTPEGKVRTSFGECRGRIVEGPRGASGFGYDPIFQPDGFEQTMAELGADEKNALSHRARALRALFDS